jgi:hypothetical protein
LYGLLYVKGCTSKDGYYKELSSSSKEWRIILNITWPNGKGLLDPKTKVVLGLSIPKL